MDKYGKLSCMLEPIKFEISIPTDDDGYILLQCEHCGNFFKITTDDIRDDRVSFRQGRHHRL